MRDPGLPCARRSTRRRSVAGLRATALLAGMCERDGGRLRSVGRWTQPFRTDCDEALGGHARDPGRRSAAGLASGAAP
jgi:hypothetical protein